MRKLGKRILAATLSAAMVFSLAACNKKDNPDDTTTAPTNDTTSSPANVTTGNNETTSSTGGSSGTESTAQYVYKDYVPTLCAYWNVHDYETNDDGYMLTNNFINCGFYDVVFNDEIHPVEGREPYEGYKFIPAMAASEPVDVTEEIKASHPEFNIPESATAGYAYTIDLNPNACWEDGTPINADTYVYSMQQLLDPQLINYRATDYFEGALCIAGAEDYYYGGRTVFNPNSADAETMKYELSDLVKGADGVYTTPEGGRIMLGLNEAYAWMGGDSLSYYYEKGYIPDADCWDVLTAAADEDGFVPVTDDTLNALFVFTNSDDWGNETYEQLGYYLSFEETYEKKEFDTVGLFKSGDYQITMVLAKSLAGFNLLYHLTSNWIVYEPYYEACKSEVGGAWTTTYCTSVDTTMSYGPYKLVSYQTDKALRLERNENWFGYNDPNYTYVDPTDGQTYQMYQTDAINCQVVADTATSKMMFFKGELMTFGLGADDIDEYRGSEYVHVTPSETLYFFIFNGFKDMLDQREAAADFDTTKYDLQTISLTTFRKAIAVTYDKEAMCAAVSPARSGGYGLLGVGYIYDPDTGARYRDTDQAKKVLCDFYSVDVADYSSLDEAVNSITGYDPVAAKELFTQAFEEALAAGYITDNDGDGISDQIVHIEYCSSATSDFIQKTIDYLNEKLKEVIVGTPFEGKIEIYESAPYSTEWSNKIKGGLSDVVLAGWSGSALDPYGVTRLYTNPSYQYDAQWFDATTVDLTLNVNVAGIGAAPEYKELTANLRAWSDALNGATVTIDGTEYCFGDGIADVETRLVILAGIEGAVLQTYDYIPMLQNAGMSLLSQQVYYVIDEYNAILGRGGIAYLKYNYNETEWAEYVASQGGELSY